MIRKLKFAMIVAPLAACLLAVPFGSALAEDDLYSLDRGPGAMTADLLLVRPLGLAAIAAGAAVFVVSLPFSALGGNAGQAYEKLLVEPAEYTLKRPLGDLHVYGREPADY